MGEGAGAPEGSYIAVDWGTTNRRCYRISGHGVLEDTFSDALGAAAMAGADYAAEIQAVRRRLGDLPVVAAGMVGSARGWREVPYVPTSAAIGDLARGAFRLADIDVVITPGVMTSGDVRPDVMRGEEIQVLGAVLASLAHADGLFCQPGTHNKWIEVRAGSIVAVATAMTGEIFSMLRRGSVLAGMLDGPVGVGGTFEDGLNRGIGCRDLATALFEVRARVLLGRLEIGQAAAFASGILIGSDVGSRAEIPGGTVYLLADGALSELYEEAIAKAGGQAVRISSHDAFVAGIHALRGLLP